MADLYDRQWIAGTDGESTPESVPESWRERVNSKVGGAELEESATSLGKAVDYLERVYDVEAREVAFKNEKSGTWDETERGIALVNPNREAAKNPQVDPVWHIPTGRYTPSGPGDIYRPLTDALYRDDEEEVFGQVRCYREGGEQHLDLFFPSHRVEIEEMELILGLTTGHDYFGGRAHTASVIGFDVDSGQVLRDITDDRKRRHTGDSTGAVTDWWTEIIETLDGVGSALRETVAESQAYEVDISDIPVDAEGFYEHLGLPAGSRVNLAAPSGRRSGLDNGPQSAWKCYKAGLETLEKDYSAKTAGGAFLEHMQSLNMLMFQPPKAWETVLRSCADSADGRTTLSGTDAHDLQERADTAAEGVEYFESKREKLRALLEDTEEEDDDEDGTENETDDTGSTDDSSGAGGAHEPSSSDEGTTSSDGRDGTTGGSRVETDGGWFNE